MKNTILAIVCGVFLSTYPKISAAYKAPMILIENRIMDEEEPCSCLEKQESEPPIQPKEKSIFARFIRPPLRTIHTMTDLLSFYLGIGTIFSGIQLIANRTVLKEEEKNLYLSIIFAWLVNKALYHFTEYAIEETN